MTSEFNASLRNTRILVPLPDQHIMGCKWVFKLKQKANNSIEHHKAQLIAMGFHQQAGIDFDESFSSVIKLTTIRTILKSCSISSMA